MTIDQLRIALQHATLADARARAVLEAEEQKGREVDLDDLTDRVCWHAGNQWPGSFQSAVDMDEFAKRAASDFVRAIRNGEFGAERIVSIYLS